MNLPALIARLTELGGAVDHRKLSQAPVDLELIDILALQVWVAEAHSALPTLLEALAIQREALEKLEQKTKGRKYNCSSGWVHQVTSRALARVDALAGKESEG